MSMQTVIESRTAAIATALTEVAPGETIIICRLLKGDGKTHSGGLDCWCQPHRVLIQGGETVDRIVAELVKREVLH